MLPLLLLLLLTENAAAAAAATPRSGLPVFDAAAGATGSMSALERAAHPPDSVLVMQLKQPQCRENCAEKFDVDDTRCLQIVDCSYCLNRCSALEHNTIPQAPVRRPHRPPTQLPRQQQQQQQAPVALQIDALTRDRSLVSADIRWRWPRASAATWQRAGGHCLVTWDVLGGGLMGNLLTDVPDVQLTLWPSTVYHVQVTCKCKENDLMFKALPLTIDTSLAIEATTTTTTTPSATTATTSTTTSASNIFKTNHHRLAITKISKKAPIPLLSSVHTNEILSQQIAAQMHQKQSRPADSTSGRDRSTTSYRSHRLSADVMLAVCLCGSAMLVVWLALLRRCDAAAAAAGPKAERSRRSDESWEQAQCDGVDAGNVPVLWVNRGCDEKSLAACPDVPLMRVIHV